MKITDDELLAIIDETTTAFGQILLTHRELAEGLLGQHATQRSQDKIDAMKKKLAAERERLTKLRRADQRKKELERIRRGQLAAKKK